MMLVGGLGLMMLVGGLQQLFLVGFDKSLSYDENQADIVIPCETLAWLLTLFWHFIYVVFVCNFYFNLYRLPVLS